METTTRNTHFSRRNSPFWFMNKIANPFVRLILSSPFHGWLSRSLLLITYQGRKSGKKYTLPVQYVQSHDTLYNVPVAAGQKTWWRNLRGGTPVEIVLCNHKMQAFAEVLSGETQSEVIAEGLKVFLQRFPAAARLNSIKLNSDGSLDAEDLIRARASVVLVRIQLDQAEDSHPVVQK